MAEQIRAEVMWAFTHKPNPMNEEKYTVDLVNLSDEAKKVCAKHGVPVKNKEGKGDFITLKSNYPIKVVNKQREEVIEGIGNGSEVLALVEPYEWTFKKQTGTNFGVRKIMVLKHIIYESGEQEDDFDLPEDVIDENL